MSFGFGVGDIIALGKLAADTYRSCKHSGEEFREISAEVSNLRIIIDDITELLRLDKSGLTRAREERLTELMMNSKAVLEDLQEELKHYSGLNTKTQRKFNAIRFGFKDLSAIRSRIASTTTCLNSIYGSLSSHSDIFIKRVLLKYAKEVNMDIHAGSVLSNRTTDSLSTVSGWKDICRELRDLGISASVLQERREFIKQTLMVAIEDGVAEDKTEGGPLTEAERLRCESTATLVEQEYTERQKRLNKKRALAAKQQALDPDLHDLSKITDHVEGKKYSRGVARLLRLFRLASDERLIEAADERDIYTVAKLIDRGVNVSVSDKWRWTALHMAAYGGYEDIAQLLIKRGAELDVRTVDGETPLKLAERNGHAKVVQLIEEEVESRRLGKVEKERCLPPQLSMASS